MGTGIWTERHTMPYYIYIDTIHIIILCIYALNVSIMRNYFFFNKYLYLPKYLIAISIIPIHFPVGEKNLKIMAKITVTSFFFMPEWPGATGSNKLMVESRNRPKVILAVSAVTEAIVGQCIIILSALFYRSSVQLMFVIFPAVCHSLNYI